MRKLQRLAPKKAGLESTPGRRSPAYTPQGGHVRAIKGGHGLDIMGTLIAAGDRGAQVRNGKITFTPEDFRGSLRKGRESNLIVFVVDASGSMAAKDRLAAVTGAVHSMLSDAYQRRDKVAVISVRGSKPELVLPPTSSIDVAHRRLQDVPTGGKTPLPEGLAMAEDLIKREALKEPGRRAILMVLSDGRATGKGGLDRLRAVAGDIAARELCASVVIDCERGGRIRLGLAKELASGLGAVCVEVDQLDARAVTGVIETI